MPLKAFIIGSGTVIIILSSGLLLLVESNVSIAENASYLNTIWLFSLALSTAIFEELVFRLWMMKSLIRTTKNTTLAIIASSLIFSLLHLGNDNVNLLALFSHFVGGVVYSVCFLYSGHISLSIGVHFSWNFIQYLFGLPMSGNIKSGLFEATLREKNSFYGDEYGIESGWFSIICRALILGAIILIYKRNGK